MWFAKPIRALAPDEITVWKEIEPRVPLAQTLAWARATETFQRRAFLVCSPEERVGGIVFCEDAAFRSSQPASQPARQVEFECINGPHLDWDDPTRSVRQLSTFAMAVSKLDRKFRSLTMKPRWELSGFERRIQSLPVELSQKSFAATVVVDVLPDDDSQRKSLSARLRRNLATAEKRGVITRWENATPDALATFVPAMQAFGRRKGFWVPERNWFEALVGGGCFWVCTAVDQPDPSLLPIAQTQVLIHCSGAEAHYLFGYDQRDPGVKGSVSTAGKAHWRALRECASLGALRYDLNGYVSGVQSSHPYSGVCRFKEQFRGRLVEYGIPEFLIKIG